MRKATEYPGGPLEKKIHRNNEHRGYQRPVDSLKVRQEGHQGVHRKHNSPDYNKYRTQQNKSNLRNRNNQEEQARPTRKQDEEAYPKKNKELTKTSSHPALDLKQLAQEQSQDYKKLHDKLNLIENKIADMKKHVQKKREEKAKMLERRRERIAQRQMHQQQSQEEMEPENNSKLDLRQFVSKEREHKELHTFEKNPYSPKHNIYYISEIIKSYRDEKSLGREHLLTSLHIFKVLENSRFATEQEMRQRQVTLPRREGYEGKKTVVFDLDQTLIHCNDTLTPPYDVKLPITFPTGQVIEAGINIRPHAQQILKNLSKHFEVIVFTASHSCYANVVLDYLDPNDQYIHHRLFRDHCYQTPEGMYCKDLRVLDRDLSQMVLVDNAAYSYAAQPDNGIPILPYYHGKSDFELRALEKYILNMVMASDVRQINRQTFQFHQYRNYYSNPERLVEEIYMVEEK